MNKVATPAFPELTLQADAQSLKSLLALESRLQERQSEIRAWFEAQWKKTPPPLYGSVDLRNAGFKLSPVDMNLFPAGFNNLNPHFHSEVIEAAKTAILERMPDAKTIGLIPESHTRNVFYWENVGALVNILQEAGFQVRVGALNESLDKEIFLKEGGRVFLESLIREGAKLRFGETLPDFILLNNDLSAGIPPILEKLEQPILPPLELGWHQRLKSQHFQYYADLSEEFAKLLDLDSWLFTPLFRSCGEVDFLKREGLDCLVKNTEILLNEVRKKYQEYGVKQQPFIIVKADSGTQGMAIMTVRNVDELNKLNRKQRTAMAKSKGGVPVSRVLVQEGVYTAETFGAPDRVAEPVVYLFGKRVAGGFYRIHEERASDENLNSPGMQFGSLPFAWSCCTWPCQEMVHPYQKHLATYGVIAQLSQLAAAREITG